MIVRDGHIIERGLSFGITHVLSFRTWQIFVAIYTRKVWPEMGKDARNKLLKDIYVHALLNNCTKSNTNPVEQANNRKKCQQK